MAEPAGPRDESSAGHPHSRTGGFTDVAREISSISGKYVTRQCVWQWWDRRSKSMNGFPDGEVKPWRGVSTRREFSLSEVVEWWAGYSERTRL